MIGKLLLLACCSLLISSVEVQAQTLPLKKEKNSQKLVGYSGAVILTPAQKSSLLKARKAVWRAYFTNDQTLLDQLVPENTIVLGNSEEKPFTRKAEILEAAKNLGERGVKLAKLEFPQTKMQVFGQVAIIYTTYHYELRTRSGELITDRGNAVEIFVFRNGSWVNPGWQLSSFK
jgi:hypothetical protein